MDKVQKTNGSQCYIYYRQNVLQFMWLVAANKKKKFFLLYIHRAFSLTILQPTKRTFIKKTNLWFL
jgi:hypothetical protein